MLVNETPQTLVNNNSNNNKAKMTGITFDPANSMRKTPVKRQRKTDVRPTQVAPPVLTLLPEYVSERDL